MFAAFSLASTFLNDLLMLKVSSGLCFIAVYYLFWLCHGFHRGKRITAKSFKYLFTNTYEIHINDMADWNNVKYLQILKDGIQKGLDLKACIVDVCHTRAELYFLDGFPDKEVKEVWKIIEYIHAYGNAKYKYKGVYKGLKWLAAVKDRTLHFPYKVCYYKILPTERNINYLDLVDVDAIAKNADAENKSAKERGAVNE